MSGDIHSFLRGVIAKRKDILESNVNSKLAEKSQVLDNVGGKEHQRNQQRRIQREMRRRARYSARKRAPPVKEKIQRSKASDDLQAEEGAAAGTSTAPAADSAAPTSAKVLRNVGRFEDYLPLHQLWSSYITDLVAGTDAAGAGARLLKADLQGAHVAVTRARDPALVGASGIVLLETANTLQLIGADSRPRLVPKQGTVLAFAAGPHAVTLYASQLMVRPADRAVRKWKAKPTIEL